MESFIVYSAYSCLAIFSIYWLLIYNRLKNSYRQIIDPEWPPVSVIICIRNQSIVFKEAIKLFLEQDYPQYELLIVDDDSGDGLESWIYETKKIESKISYFKNNKTKAGKKQALTTGITNAKYKWLAFTDADCRPTGKYWLKSMMASRKKNDKIILGYAPYQYKQGFLNKFIRFESCFNALQYLSASQIGFPYMGSGRNLVYHKSVFNADALQNELMYGDDDLLINAQSNSKNTCNCIESESFIYSDAKSTYLGYFKQRWRHYAASLHYNISSSLLLLTYYCSFAGLYLSVLFLLYQKSFYMASSLYVCHLLVSWPVFCNKLKIFKEKELCLYFPFLQIIYFFHLLLQFPFLWIQKKQW